jgi:hypothetical protein
MARIIPKITLIALALVFSFWISGATKADTTKPSIQEILSCLPPSALECSDQNSYSLLAQRQRETGIFGSEIGNEQLASCSQQIADYQRELTDFNACAPNLGLNFSQPNIITPLISPYACSAFLGDHGQYNSTTKMCECNSGYILYQSECRNPIEICQNKYGPDFTAKYGDCVPVQNPVKTQTPSPSPKTYIPDNILKLIPTIQSTPHLDPAINLHYVPDTELSNGEPMANQKPGAILKVWKKLSRAVVTFIHILIP